jgi:threonine dehydrogenase-like Zn-dependent dehydrogenase
VTVTLTGTEGPAERGVLPATARASVALPGSGSEIQRLPITSAGEDDGWLRVTSSGICGTDVGLHAAGVAAPTVLGHHVVGEIAAVGADAARRWGAAAGSRVVLEEYLPCGTCATCRTGTYRLCAETDLWGGGRRIGTIPVSEAPGLLGGNSEYLYLPPNAVVHPLPETLDKDLAAWVLPYANALDWTAGAGRLAPGETVVVLGPGYHGLAVVAAAVAGGAERVVVGGPERDAERLAMAEALGALPVVLDRSDVAGRIRAASARDDVALVVDAVGSDPDVVGPAVDLLGHGGRLVLTSPKKPAQVGLDTSVMIRRSLTVRAVRGRAPEAVAAAIASLADGSSHLERVPTVEIPLDGVGDMLSRLAAGAGPESPHVVVRPTA